MTRIRDNVSAVKSQKVLLITDFKSVRGTSSRDGPLPKSVRIDMRQSVTRFGRGTRL